jgi:hypothetical protein
MHPRPLVPACVMLVLLATGSNGQARSTQATTIRVLSIVRTSAESDVDPKGLSAGDRTATTDRLYNLVAQFGKPKDALIGTDWGVLTVLAGKKAAKFRGIARLPGGTIEARGLVSLVDPVSTVIVTGGTGHFLGVRGRVTMRALNANGRAINIFKLTGH